MSLRTSIIFVGLVLSSLSSTTTISGEPEAVLLSGTVEELTDVLKAHGLTVDSEPIAKQVVLKAKDGTITPILSDGASRALFLDNRLRGRPVELNCRKRPGLPYIQVVSFKIEENGKLQIPEYYCEICTIAVRFPQICPCCQGDMVLRMKPDPH